MVDLKSRTVVAPLFVALSYVVIGVASSRIVQPLYAGELLWLPGGFALGIAVLYSRTALLGVVPGGFLLALWLGFAPLPALVIGLASAVGTWMGATIAPRSWRKRAALRSLADVRAIWWVSAVTSGVTAVLVALNPFAANGDLASRVVYAGEFLLADVLGIALLLPVVLAVLGSKDRSERTGTVAELVTVLALLVMATVLSYAVGLPLSFERSMPYLLGPLFILLVLRFGWREVSFAVILMAPVAFASASRGVGPFSGGDVHQSRLLLQLVFIGATMLAQLIVVLTGERQRIIRELELSRDELEQRVSLRTAELEAANRVLASEMLEREHAEAQLQDQQASLERIVYERTSELEDANWQLTSAMHVKSQFLANMSHELRTPLNSIIGFTDLLGLGMAGELTEEQLHQIKLVNSSGKHLLALVNDVLDITSIEAGAARLVLSSFSLRPVVQQVLESVRPLAAAKGLTLQVEIGEDQLVCTDRTKLEQILINLVGNAIKFTPAGGVRVSFEASGATLDVHVSDTGIGIASEELTDIFEEFHQSRSIEAGKPVGTGLGLAISRRLARILGGDLVVESEIGLGSMFTLSLPGACVLDAGEEPVEVTSG